MKGYTTQDVAALLDIPAGRIRTYARAGFITPDRDERGAYRFSFQDLVLLRTAAELSRQHVPPRRITETLTKLRSRLPHGRSLSELRIHASGDEIVVREASEPPWNPGSGQFHLDFDVGEFASRVAPLAQRLATAAHEDADDRTAADWFALGVELEAVAPAEAIAAYEAALREDDALHDARVNLARLLCEADERARAEREYRRVLDVCEHALAAYNLGVLLEDTGREEDAIRSYGRALAADPKLAEAHFNLARIHERRGEQHAAIRHFNGYRELVLRR